MANLGTIGAESIIGLRSTDLGPRWLFNGMKESVVGYRSTDVGPRSAIRCLCCGDEYQVVGGRDNAEGSPAQPCIRLDSRGVWRFRWRVRPGTRTIQINAKQAANLSPRPSLVVKANPGIGVAADATGTAGSSTGWITIGPVTVTPTIDGVVWVELRNNYDAQFSGAPCYFDHVVTK